MLSSSLRRSSFGAAVLVGLALLGGCETEERHGPIRPTGALDASLPPSNRYADLKEQVEKDPQNPSGWFNLASYYEECQDWRAAIACYERGNELIDQKQWTGGNYFLGRAYLRVNDYIQAMRHLDLVVSLESPDPKVACLNPHFAEAHYLKGAIFYVNKNWRKARNEFNRFLELGGDDNRVEEYLEHIDREVR